MKKIKLSVVLATRNEENNIGRCLEAVKGIADEIVIVDEESVDKTREIAKKFGAKVFVQKHEPIFHVTKQKALDLAKGDWILQLDADEVVTKELAHEILNVIYLSSVEIKNRRPKDLKKWNLFLRHEKIIEKRDGQIGKKTGEVVAFFLPRRNMFLGKALIHAGVYPDPAIRLIKRGKASFPAKSVHEIMSINGEIAWLFNDLEHHDSPTLKRYFMRLNRYTDLQADELKELQLKKNLFSFLQYVFYYPSLVFIKLFLRHKGFKDGMRGFMWSFLSATHFPIAYFKYITSEYN